VAEAGAASPAVHTVQLAKRYGATVALAGLSMTVPRGEVFGFLGPNGAGKTTAVKLLLGLARPSRGEAMLLGAPVGDRQARRRVGYLPELFRYQGWLRAAEVLGLHCRLARLPRSGWGDAIRDALALVGLAERGQDRVQTFSKGMQQRLGLGVALLGRPALVFLDEPTSALDPVGRHDVRTIVSGLRDRGTTVFLNSHLLSEVEQICDRVAVVDHGRVVAEGRLQEMLAGDVVRVRCSDLRVEQLPELSRFGALTLRDGVLVAERLAQDLVPDLVASLVGLGARIHQVEPGRRSLEEHFLTLLRQP